LAGGKKILLEVKKNLSIKIFNIYLLIIK